MKKKALEKLPLMLATDEMMQMVKADKGKNKTIYRCYSNNEQYILYKKYTYIRAQIIQDSILEVSIFRREQMAAGIKEPAFIIFLDKSNGEFASYKVREEKWSNAKIDMLNDILERGEYLVENTVYEDEKSAKVVNEYFDTTNQPIRRAVLQFQFDIRKEQLKEKYRRETDEIDDVMELVPELPTDFKSWMKEYGFYTSRFIAYHTDSQKKEREAYCLQCGSTIKVIYPRRDKKCKCPVCKKEAILKPWKAARIREHSTMCVLQRITDNTGWVARRINAIMIADSGENWVPKYYMHEEVRELYDDNLFQYNHYEYGCYRTTGMNRWCYSCNEPNRKAYYRDDFTFGDARVYWNNLSKERKDTVLKYIPIEKALRRSPGTYIKLHTMMNELRHNPQIEYLIKMGFERLSVDALNGYIKYKDGKRLWEVLGVSKELMLKAKEYDVSARELETLQEAEKLGYQLTKIETRFFTKYLHKDIKKLVIYATPHKFYRYFHEVLKNHKKYGDYLDYLEAAKKCKYDMSNEMILFPKNFTQAHDDAVADRLEREKKLEAMKAKQKDREYKKLVPDIKAMFEYEDDNFFIKVPEKKADFTSEGHNNHNCVATYFDKALKGDCVIVFIRKKSEPDKSFCTVEIRNTISIQQLRSGYNKDAPEEAKEFANKWMKEVDKRQRKKIAEKRIQIAVAAVG